MNCHAYRAFVWVTESQTLVLRRLSRQVLEPQNPTPVWGNSLSLHPFYRYKQGVPGEPPCNVLGLHRGAWLFRAPLLLQKLSLPLQLSLPLRDRVPFTMENVNFENSDSLSLNKSRCQNVFVCLFVCL